MVQPLAHRLRITWYLWVYVRTYGYVCQHTMHHTLANAEELTTFATSAGGFLLTLSQSQLAAEECTLGCLVGVSTGFQGESYGLVLCRGIYTPRYLPNTFKF